MAKKNESTESVTPVTQKFFFPPQDGRDAFVCEAVSQEEADGMYRAVELEK